jgi:hypothetical protein
MSDLFDQVTQDQDIIKKLFSKIPGFKGYIEREDRRLADKLLREMVAKRYEEQWQRISSIQTELISQGGIEFVDDIERAAIKLRQFIDRVRTAAYGYAGFFDAIKVKEDELAAVYRYDLSLLEAVEQIASAVNNLEGSIGTDGMPAAIRHLTTLSQQSVELYNRRSDVITGTEAL